MGMLGHGQSPAVSALWSSKVPRLFFQTFIFTDGEDEELKKQARESLCVRGLSARCLGLCWSPAQHPQPGECQKKKNPQRSKCCSVDTGFYGDVELAAAPRGWGQLSLFSPCK